MADLALAPRSMLDGHLAFGRHGVTAGDPGVTIAERKGRRLFAILAKRGRTAALEASCAGYGFTLPSSPRRNDAPGGAVTWTAPGQWLAESDHATGERPLERFFASLDACAIVALDEARVVLTVAGPRARDTLAKMLTIDLHPRALKPGDAAATLAGTIGVTLWLRDEVPTFDLAVPRGFARSFCHWLMDSAAEFGCLVQDEAALPG